MADLKISNKEYRARKGVSSNFQEEWRDIKGYEGWYQVSNFGRIKRLKKTHYSFGMKQLLFYNKWRNQSYG